MDSNVIIDVATSDPTWGNWSSSKLVELADRWELAINPLIYAEVSIGFATIEELEEAVPSNFFRRLPLPWEAAFLAGKAFAQYKLRFAKRSAPLPDFYIGAHAAVAGLSLLTRDSTRYRTYFPAVDIICP